MLPIRAGNMQSQKSEDARALTFFEVIDAGEFARRWSIPKSWILEQTRSRATEPIPCVRLGRYVALSGNRHRSSSGGAKSGNSIFGSSFLLSNLTLS